MERPSHPFTARLLGHRAWPRPVTVLLSLMILATCSAITPAAAQDIPPAHNATTAPPAWRTLPATPAPTPSRPLARQLLAAAASQPQLGSKRQLLRAAYSSSSSTKPKAQMPTPAMGVARQGTPGGAAAAPPKQQQPPKTTVVTTQTAGAHTSPPLSLYNQSSSAEAAAHSPPDLSGPRLYLAQSAPAVQDTCGVPRQQPPGAGRKTAGRKLLFVDGRWMPTGHVDTLLRVLGGPDGQGLQPAPEGWRTGPSVRRRPVRGRYASRRTGSPSGRQPPKSGNKPGEA